MISAVARWRQFGSHTPTFIGRLSNNPALREAGDLLVGVADGGEDLLVVLAQLGGGRTDGLARGAVRDRVPENRDVAEDGRLHRLRDLQMAHLLVGEGLVDAIDRSAGHAGVV